jgi:hypothetical protein
VFRKNERRVSQVLQFRETAEIRKETSFAKHKFNYFSFNSCKDACLSRLWHSWALLNQNLTALNVNVNSFSKFNGVKR